MAKIIINADDFGISNQFDEAILDLIKKNYLRSTSVIISDEVNLDHAKKLKQLAQSKKISIGLHFVHEKHPNEKKITTDNHKLIQQKLEEQYKNFINLFQTNPSHLDKHNWDQNGVERRLMCELAIEKNIPLRLHRQNGFFYETKYQYQIKLADRQYNLSSNKYGLRAIKKDINELKNNDDVCEAICHPGFYDHRYDGTKFGTNLNKNREQEYKKVIRLNNFLRKNGISISSFLDF
jgi:predicted glycoside hydrolase/deacetylase ChbG (UPF0249 family)